MLLLAEDNFMPGNGLIYFSRHYRRDRTILLEPILLEFSDVLGPPKQLKLGLQDGASTFTS